MKVDPYLRVEYGLDPETIRELRERRGIMVNFDFSGDFLKKVALSFARAFIGAFIAGATGLLTVPDWNAGKAALVALVVAALTAGVRAVQHIVLDTPPA